MSPGTPTWRSFSRQENNVTVERLRLLCSSGSHMYGVSPENPFSIVAKVEVNTEEPIYPCRPSEYREVKGDAEYHVKQEFVNAVTLRLVRIREREAWRKYEEFRAAWKNDRSKTLKKCLSREERESVERVWKRIARRAGSPSGKGAHNWERVFTGLRRESPCHDKDKFTYPTGRFTTWLRTNEIRHALAHGRLVECHNLRITIFNAEHQRLWKRLRNEAFKRYGRTCMRCGCTTGEMHIDHINPWSEFPEQRYDLENLQVLCHACNASKRDTDADYRPSCGYVMS